MPRWLAHTLVAIGWLLTPLWAYGASLCGAWLGARFGVRMASPAAMVGVTLLTAAVAGFGVLWAWVRWMRRVPHLLSHHMAPRRSLATPQPQAPDGR